MSPSLYQGNAGNQVIGSVQGFGSGETAKKNWLCNTSNTVPGTSL